MNNKLKSSILLLLATFSIIACGNGSGGSDGNGNNNSDSSQSHWAKSYGGPNGDGAFFSVIHETSDEGYIIAGDTYSFGEGGSDMWVIKLNSDDSIAWQKTYGGGGFDGVSFIQETSGGGYIVAGNTGSFGTPGLNNIWVLKLNSSGGITWQKAYGGTLGFDVSSFIQQTSDGGYIIAGLTNSYGAGGNDFWVIKLNSTGTIVWQKTYGGSNSDEAYAIKQTSDDGYIVAGLTNSFGSGSNDVWILKLNSNGAISWQKTLGGSGSEWASYVHQTSDGGYILSGLTESFGAGNTDFWVLKLNSSGGITWQKTYGGSGDESASFIQQTSDSGYVVAGQTSSFGAGNTDFWVLKLNSSGGITWQKTYGGSESEGSYYIQQTTDNGYAVSGQTQSFGAGMRDIWLLKLKLDGTISPTAPSNIGADTSATVQNTSVASIDTFVIPVDSTAPTVNTSVIGVDSNATVQTQASN